MQFDERTERNIGTLNKNAQSWARAFMQKVLESGKLPDGWSCRIISGNRTWSEQEALWAQGRTKPGAKVTNARGGQSNHNFGIAWDIGLFHGGRYNPPGAMAVYRALGAIGKEMGLAWGGDWKRMPDVPHFEVPTTYSLAEKRAFILAGGVVPVLPYGQPNPSDKPDPLHVVKIEENGFPLDIPARLIEGQTWVALRPFVDHFGGSVTSIRGGGRAAIFSVAFDGRVANLAGRIDDTVGMVKFADINAVLDWAFTYRAGVLNVHTGNGGKA
jgi:hypothetical protein